MTSKRVFGILAVMALVALSATGAQAGHGGVPSALTSFFVCKGISGDDAARRVDVDSNDTSSWGFNLQNVRLGVATLACAFARLYPGGSTTHTPCLGGATPPACNEITPNPLVGSPPSVPLDGEYLKCYAISGAKGQTSAPTPPPSYAVTDGLLGTDDNVTGSSITYVCAPANFLQN
jgi:hypothetical protein